MTKPAPALRHDFRSPCRAFPDGHKRGSRSPRRRATRFAAMSFNHPATSHRKLLVLAQSARYLGYCYSEKATRIAVTARWAERAHKPPSGPRGGRIASPLQDLPRILVAYVCHKSCYRAQDKQVRQLSLFLSIYSSTLCIRSCAACKLSARRLRIL